MTKCMHIQIMNLEFWDKQVELEDSSRAELEFWAQNLMNLNGKPILTECKVDKIVFSDASNVAFGG